MARSSIGRFRLILGRDLEREGFGVAERRAAVQPRQGMPATVELHGQPIAPSCRTDLSLGEDERGNRSVGKDTRIEAAAPSASLSYQLQIVFFGNVHSSMFKSIPRV